MIITLSQWYATFLSILFLSVCLFMMLVILIQKPRGGGLTGAFGGGGGSAQAVFGAKTGDVLTWFTVVCFSMFLLLAISLAWAVKPSSPDDAPQIVPTQPPPTTNTSEPAAATPPPTTPDQPAAPIADPAHAPSEAAQTPAPTPATETPR